MQRPDLLTEAWLSQKSSRFYDRVLKFLFTVNGWNIDAKNAYENIQYAYKGYAYAERDEVIPARASLYKNIARTSQSNDMGFLNDSVDPEFSGSHNCFEDVSRFACHFFKSQRVSSLA